VRQWLDFIRTGFLKTFWTVWFWISGFLLAAFFLSINFLNQKYQTTQPGTIAVMPIFKRMVFTDGIVTLRELQ